MAFLTALAGGAAFHQAGQGRSFWNDLYWSLTTMTTVGDGGLTPHTTAGKLIAIAVMLVGIGFVALLTGAVAEAFIRPRAERAIRHAVGTVQTSEGRVLQQLDDISSRIARIEQTLGRFIVDPRE
jgi:voltage-gated potassium channel